MVDLMSGIPVVPTRSPNRTPWMLFLAVLMLLTATVAAIAANLAVSTVRQMTATSATVIPGTVAAPLTMGGTADASAIAAKVDPAIVDITTVLANGGGTAAGTGIVITPSGEVLTNEHVIAGATSIKVQVSGAGPRYTATVVGADSTNDVALLQVHGVSGLTPVSIGDSSKLAIGDSIVAIGNALGKGGTPAAAPGTVTALGQTITASDLGGGTAQTLTGLVRINALIQPGDSGGPLVDTSGSVVGIDTAAQVRGGRSRQSAGSNIGFAIPINTAMAIARHLETAYTA